MGCRPVRQMKITPYTIQNIMEQLRHGMVGALAYVGGHELFFNHPADGRDSECRSTFRSYFDENSALKYEVGLSFRVKSKPDEGWRMVIAYEPDDTYTIWLLRDSNQHRRLHLRAKCEVILSQDDVNDDDLQNVVETLYDEAIRSRSQERLTALKPFASESQFS